MEGSIDPRCETLRGTHWPNKGRVVVWNSRRGNHLGQRSTNRINRPDIWMQAIRSHCQKLLVARGPSTYGSRLKAGTTLWFYPLPREPRPAIQPRQVAIIIFRRFRAHDGVAQPGMFAGRMVDVLADGAG
jgi:hypothetical protein